LGRCSADKPKYCSSVNGFDLVYKCGLNSGFCPCPPNFPACETGGECRTAEEFKGECERQDNASKCVTAGNNVVGGVCYWDSIEGKCKPCPDLTKNDCSFYNSSSACEMDSCFLGKSGLGSGFYESEVAFVDYFCEWYENKCVLYYNTQDRTGKKCACKTTQKLSECVNDAATLTWTKRCTSLTEDTTCEFIPDERTTPIACGRAVSPLPFFSFFNFVAVLSILFVYYIFRVKGRLKVKEKGI